MKGNRKKIRRSGIKRRRRRLAAQRLECRHLLAAEVFESEPNDQIGSADAFSNSQVLRGSFSTAADSDYFRTSLQQGDTLTIDPRYSATSAGDRQPFAAFDLLDSSGTVIIESTDLFQSIFVASSPGDYYVRIHSGNRFDLPTTDYAIDVRVDSFSGVTESEPNDTTTEATGLARSGSIRGQLSQVTDADVYAIDADSGQTLILDLVQTSPAGGAYPVVSLRNASGTVLKSDSTGQGFVYSITENATYYVSVEEMSGLAFPYRYTATLSLHENAQIEPERGDELPDHEGTWSITEAPSSRASILESVGDIDVYEIEGRGLEWFRFDLGGFSGDHHAFAGRRLSLLNASGQLIGYAEQTHLQHQLLPVLSTPGRYFLLVEATSELGVGSYSVNATAIKTFSNQRDIPLYFFDFHQQLPEHRGRVFESAFEDPQHIPFLIGAFEAIYDRHDIDVTTVLPEGTGYHISHGTGGFEGTGHDGNGKSGFRGPSGSSVADSIRGFPTGNINHEIGHAISLNHVRHNLQQVTWRNLGKGLFPGDAFGFNIGPVATEIIYNHADQADWVSQAGAQFRHPIGYDETVDLNSLIAEMKYDPQMQPSVEAGSHPHYIVAGDFDGDNIRDLATANSGDGSVSILYGNLGGDFAPAVNHDLGPSAFFADTLVSADFNGDGFDDLAYSNYVSSGSISILLGASNRQFSSGVSLAAGNRPNSIRSGDFNGDAIPDLAVANYFGASVTLFIGNGDGTFATGATLLTNGRRSNGIELADLNGDGHTDLLVSDSLGAAVATRMGRGDGTFDPVTRIPVPSDSQDVVALDLNGDTFLDAASISRETGQISLLLNDGAGNLTLADTLEGRPGAFMIERGDFNGDGLDDLAVPVRDASIVEVHLNNGQGVFLRPVQFDSGGLDETGILVEDSNQDGADDLWIAESRSDSIRLLSSAENSPRNDRAVIHGSIDSPQQRDHFTLWAESGDTYLFDIDAAEFQYPIDAALVIKDQTGTVIATSNDSLDPGSGIDSIDPSLLHTFDSAGNYTVEVYGEHQSQGKYRLKVTPSTAFDDAGPRVLRAFPEQGDSIDQTRQLIFWLNDAIDPESITPQSFQVVGQQTGVQSGSATFDPVKKILIWYADELLPIDQYSVTIDGLTDPIGNPLDGETNGLNFPTISGDGIAGGALQFSFTIDAIDETPALLNSLEVVESEYSSHLIHLDFNEHLDIRQTQSTNAVLTNLGSDNTLGTADDYSLLLDTYYWREFSDVETPARISLMSRGYLDSGNYQLTVDWFDEAGNSITIDQPVVVSPTVTPYGVSVTGLNFQPGIVHQRGTQQQIEVQFSNPIDPQTLTTETFRLRYSPDAEFFDDNDQMVLDADGFIEWQSQTLTAILRSNAPLQDGFYLVEIDGDESGLRSATGQLLDGEYLGSNIAGSTAWSIYPYLASGDGRPGGDYRSVFHIADYFPGSPTIERIVRDIDQTEITNDDTLNFIVDFSEDVYQIDTSDFVVVGGVTASVTEVAAVQGTGEAMFELTIAGGNLEDFDGTVGLELSSDQDIQDVLGNTLLNTLPDTNETFLVDNTAPTAVAVVPNQNQISTIRSIHIDFDSEVLVDPGALTILNQSGHAVGTISTLQSLGSQSRLSIQFTGDHVDDSGSLFDGFYRLILDEDLVHDLAGNSIDGNRDGLPGGTFYDEFFRLYGDFDGDQDVDIQDLGQFHWHKQQVLQGQSVAPAFDVNADGLLDGYDLQQFRQNLSRKL